MCGVHLCDDQIRRIFEAGPVSLFILPPQIMFHFAQCEECTDKLVTLIASNTEEPMPVPMKES